MSTPRSVFPWTVLAAALATGVLAATPAAADEAQASTAEGSGLRAPGDAPWPRWQGRLGLTTTAPLHSAGPTARPDSGLDLAIPTATQSLSLLGDYYFVQQGGLSPQGGYGGGFRATGGLLLGNRAALGSALPAGAAASLGGGFSFERRQAGAWGVAGPGDAGDLGGVPYVGVGYTGLRSLRGTGGGWAFSADLGVMALQPSSAFRLGQQAISDTLRDLQFSPLLQVGVSYSF
jgi:hypothetical protein